MHYRNPIAFRQGPVTFWTTLVYLAVIIPLLFVHENVPPAPSDEELPRGINLTEAWLDLQTMTRNYHPFNSHENDLVRKMLMERAKQILNRNEVSFRIETLHQSSTSVRVSGQPSLTFGEPSPSEPLSERDRYRAAQWHARHATEQQLGVTLFDDRVSNVTYVEKGSKSYSGQYFEGSNFYIYIRGKDDPEGEWWSSKGSSLGPQSVSRNAGGVLVNCHLDSVSTGFGATDDGTACISMLQLLSYFTSEGQQPRNGIVLLFNNGEEDGLLGAHAFGNSPLLDFCHTFVNLEGAGAGGRAMLFRATDLQVVDAYADSPHPFGSVVAANAFKRRIIRSGTDYEVFADVFGQRGIDIAFYAPRSRYHTEEDDARHTSVNSIWHMLSAALRSSEKLAIATNAEFSGPRADGRKDLVRNGRPTEGIWFDWFGDAWTALPLRGLFAWSLTLLVATPLILLVVAYTLIRCDKYYYFSTKSEAHSDVRDFVAELQGWTGFFRFPFALIFAVASTLVPVYLVAKFNPLVVYSSGYAVWAMTLSAFFFATWLIMRGSSFVRPSALHRGFALTWLFILTWVFQVFAAAAEDRMHIGAFYFAAFLHTAVFLSLLISLLEHCALPTKRKFAEELFSVQQGQEDHLDRPTGADANEARHSNERSGISNDNVESEEAPSERTPLLTGDEGSGSNRPTTFAGAYRRSAAAAETAPEPAKGMPPAFDCEQAWSGWLPTWTWFLQLLLLVPVHVSILGNLGLVAMTSTAMTGTDGSNLLAPLLGIGVISILLLLPLTPFIHRFTHHIPICLLVVFVGTLIYNLTTFPFSINHRFKFRFQQVMDLGNSTNIVSLSGLEEFVRPVIASLPSAAGQKISCVESEVEGLVDCRYDASSLAPDPANGKNITDVMFVSTSRSSDGESASIEIEALNTRTCFLDVSTPIFGFSVGGGGSRDDRFGPLPEDGFQHLQVWRRSWEGKWNVTLELAADGHSRSAGAAQTRSDPEDVATDRGELKARSSDASKLGNDPLEVSVRCAWDDANQAETIPALHELLRYMPQWATVTKKTVGLVQVKKTYKVS